MNSKSQKAFGPFKSISRFLLTQIKSVTVPVLNITLYFFVRWRTVIYELCGFPCISSTDFCVVNVRKNLREFFTFSFLWSVARFVHHSEHRKRKTVVNEYSDSRHVPLFPWSKRKRNAIVRVSRGKDQAYVCCVEEPNGMNEQTVEREITKSCNLNKTFVELFKAFEMSWDELHSTSFPLFICEHFRLGNQ